MSREAPIYVHTHDMLAWLTNHLEHWPRTQRFFLAGQVLETAVEFYRLLLRARKVPRQQRGEVLLEADVRLEVLKGLLRLGQEKRYMSVKQFQHVSRMLLEIGRELGGWRLATSNKGS